MKPRIAVIIIAVCLAGALAITWFTKHRENKSLKELDERLSNYYYCEACGNEFRGSGNVREIECPKCGQMTDIVRYKKKCEACGTIYVQFEYRISDMMSREPGTDDWGPGFGNDTPCPDCGSSRVSTYPRIE